MFLFLNLFQKSICSSASLTVLAITLQLLLDIHLEQIRQKALQHLFHHKLHLQHLKLQHELDEDFCIDSNIWVAVITGLPAATVFFIIIFEQKVIFLLEFQHQGHHEQPLYHLLLLVLNQNYQDLLDFLFRDYFTFSPPIEFKSFLISSTSSAFLINEAAIKLHPFWTPNVISEISFQLKL